MALPLAGPVVPGARTSAPAAPLVMLPLTVTPPFMTLQPQTLFASPGEPAASDALAGGLSELQLRELPSAAIVGSLSPAQPLPAELSDCRWAQSEDVQLDCHVQVFLPPGYFESERRYPVVYLLHGWGGWDPHIVNSEWNLYGTYEIADRLMRDSELQPFIIVVPEGGHSYWLNHAGDGERWGDYVATDVVSFTDEKYRTLPGRENRAIGGLSMGGLGAMQLALNHPDEFSVVGMRSPTLRRIGDPDVPPFFGDEAYYADYDPFDLAAKAGSLDAFAVYTLIGDQDMWLARTQAFVDLLDAKHARTELRVYPGGHDGPFFGSHLDEELRFYGAHLAGR